jgi:hypothetical protein
MPFTRLFNFFSRRKTPTDETTVRSGFPVGEPIAPIGSAVPSKAKSSKEERVKLNRKSHLRARAGAEAKLPWRVTTDVKLVSPVKGRVVIKRADKWKWKLTAVEGGEEEGIRRIPKPAAQTLLEGYRPHAEAASKREQARKVLLRLIAGKFGPFKYTVKPVRHARPEWLNYAAGDSHLIGRNLVVNGIQGDLYAVWNPKKKGFQLVVCQGRMKYPLRYLRRCDAATVFLGLDWAKERLSKPPYNFMFDMPEQPLEEERKGVDVEEYGWGELAEQYAEDGELEEQIQLALEDGDEERARALGWEDEEEE